MNNNQSICDVMNSISLIDSAISQLITAESMQIQKSLNTQCISNDQLISINCSAQSFLESLTKLKAVLQCKLKLISCS